MQTTDAELVRACLEGDRDAWEIVVRRHQQRLYNVAFRFTGRFDVAEELTQEIYLKVYQSLGSYKPESGMLITWMIRIARNHAIDHYRKYRTERAQTDSIELEHEKVYTRSVNASGPVEAIEKKELSEVVHRMLLRLPWDLREVVILRDLEELNYEEIAHMLDVPLGTVKSRINRGRAELARLLRSRQNELR